MKDSSIRQQIFAELRKKHCSIKYLCERFNLTRNAVKYQLDILIKGGYVGSEVHREQGKTGKPGHYYYVLPEKEFELSKAYIPFLRAALDSFRTQLSAEQFDRALERIAEFLPKPDISQYDSALMRLQKAAALMDDLGALTEIHEHHDHYELCSYSCPLAVLVREYEPVCDVVSRYFSQITGGNVLQQCDNQLERPFCHFLITILADD